MTNAALFTVLLAAGALTPGAALGQEPAQLAMARPQPHFVAAWAPKKEREAERSAVLARRVSLELTDVSLDAALKALTNQAGLRITYSPAVLPAGKRVTISASDVAVVTALTEMLFRSGLDVVVDRDGALALVVCRHRVVEAVQDSGAIVGRVTDKTTGSPLAGATVVVEGTKLSASTNNEGQYRIARIEEGTYTLRARYIGYAVLSTSVTVGAGEEATADFGLEKSAQKLDELVTVTPGGMQTQARALPTPISVIEASQIERQGPTALADVIRQNVPSAVAFYSPALPISSFFSVRGASTISGNSSMKVFIDGVEAASFSFSSVDPASIDRIEVIRGPQASTLYGSDAAGGVVQIFTKRGNPNLTRPQLHLSAAAGVAQTPYDGFGTVFRQEYTAAVNGGGAGGSVSYDFGGGYTRLPDWVPNGELSTQETGSLYGAMRYTDRIFTADLHARYYPGSYGTVSNPLLAESGFVFFSRPSLQRQDYTNETYGARFTLAPTAWWRNNISLGVDRLSNESTQSEPRLTTPADTLLSLFDTRQRKVSVGLNTALSFVVTADLSGSVTAGLDHYNFSTGTFFTFQALNVDGSIRTYPAGAIDESRVTTTNTGYFAQAEFNWRSAAFLTAGLRAEDNSSFGRDLATPVSPRVGLSLVHQIGGASVKLRGAYGRAIRAPLPLQALGGRDPFSITLPNPLLAPERQRGWDAGVDLIGRSGAFLNLTGYQQIADNLVSRNQLPSDTLPTFQYQNVGRIRNRGIEIEGGLNALSWLQLKGQYAYVDSRIQDLGPGVSPGAALEVGDRPGGQPTHAAGAALVVTPRVGSSVSAGFSYVGKFRSFDAVAFYRCLGGTGPCQASFRDYIVEYPGFERVNLSVTQRLTPSLDGQLSISNLTNDLSFDGNNSQPVMGRITMVGLRFSH